MLKSLLQQKSIYGLLDSTQLKKKFENKKQKGKKKEWRKNKENSLTLARLR